PQYNWTGVFQVGNFVVSAGGKQELNEADRRLLAEAIRKKADTTPLPPMRTYLPEAGRLDKTERYALGPIGFGAAAKALGRADARTLVDQAGFSSGAEAMFARYRSGRNEATLLLLEYPTPQLAELHLKHMQRAILALKNDSSVERKGS